MVLSEKWHVRGQMDQKNSARPIKVRFYKTDSGSEPVREWLRDMDEVDRRIIGNDLMTVQWGWPVGMPLCRPMGSGLWEVRSTLDSHRIARVLFCFHGGVIVALHGIIKKTQKAPIQDLRLAQARQKEVER
jgi:phage-related protein